MVPGETYGRLGVALLLSASLAASLPAQEIAAEAASEQRLLAELKRLAPLAGGVVGVGARHLESDREVFLRPLEPFPMASTYKVPIAVQLLSRVDRGEIGLDRRVEVQPSDLHPGSGTLSVLFDDPGVVLSLRNLLELMLLISDNSATDIVLREAGGAEAVSRKMALLGFEGVRVDRPTELLIADYLGIDDLGEESARTRETFASRVEALSDDERERAGRDFATDPRDTATPRDMTMLLAALWRGELLSASSTELLVDIMSRSTTGKSRIRGMLTADARVAHKTGTIGGTTNDLGILTLPGRAGHVALVVFVKASELEVPERELAIAHIARAVHDYFLFLPD